MKKAIISIGTIAALTLTGCSTAPSPAYGGQCDALYGMNSALYKLADWLVISGGYETVPEGDRGWLTFKAGYSTVNDYNAANDDAVAVLRRVRDLEAVTLEEKTEIVLFLDQIKIYEDNYSYEPEKKVHAILEDFSATKAAIAERCVAEQSKASK